MITKPITQATFDGDLTEVLDAARALQKICHNRALNAGWWHCPATGQVSTLEYIKDVHFSKMINLIHSEVSEAVEADRKGLMDEHLPHRQGVEVELADAVIRIFDLAGGMQLDIGAAIAEKLAYNAQRADHKMENRKLAGGKRY